MVVAGATAPLTPTNAVVVTRKDRTRTLIRTATPAAAAALARTLSANGMTASVQMHGNFLLDAPNDPRWTYQWGLGTIGAPGYWSASRGAGVVVAVVDTGVDATSRDLAGQVLDGVTILNGVTTAGAADDNGHGTHVAGIIGALTNNGIGVASVAPDVRILPVKVLDSNGYGFDPDIAAGIDYAVEHGADIINLSLGATSPVPALVSSLGDAAAKNVLVVAAAGNSYLSGNPVTYPAAYDHTIAVGATDSLDRHAEFSETGSFVDLTAPGVAILSTYPGGYEYLSGTSMATPFVAGALAVLESEHPGWTPEQVTSTLEASAADLGVAGRDDTFGWGRIDLAKATTAMDPMVTSSPTPTPTATAPGPTATPETSSPSPTTPPPGPTPSSQAPTPTAPAPPARTRLSIGSADGVLYGNRVTVSGHLTSSGSSLPGRAVDLYRAQARGRWSLLATKVTDRFGAVGFGLSPRAATTYRLAFAGDGGNASSVSAARTVRVTPKLTVKVARVGSSRTLTYGSCLACGGAKVVLQIYRNATWTTLATTTVTSRNTYLLRRRTSSTAVTCRVLVSDVRGLTSVSRRFSARLR